MHPHPGTKANEHQDCSALSPPSPCWRRAPTRNQGATTGTGAAATAAGPAPGSEEDLVANVGDRVFFDFDKSNLKTGSPRDAGPPGGVAGQVSAGERAGRRQLRRARHRGIQPRARPAPRQRRRRLPGGQGRGRSADHHDQLRQGSSRRDGLTTSRPGRRTATRSPRCTEPTADRLELPGTGGPWAAGFVCDRTPMPARNRRGAVRTAAWAASRTRQRHRLRPVSRWPGASPAGPGCRTASAALRRARP